MTKRGKISSLGDDRQQLSAINATIAIVLIIEITGDRVVRMVIGIVFI